MHFKINSKGYSQLIEAVLENTARIHIPKNDDQAETRRKYIKQAIASGIPLETIPQNIAELSTRELKTAMQRLPDKGLDGNGLYSAEENRSLFSKAAELRAPEMRWDNLFTGNSNDIVLPFVLDAVSIDDRIGDYIKKHNALAVDRYSASEAEYEQRRLLDPEALRSGRRPVEELELRRDPEKPGLLQSRPANNLDEKWKPDRRLGKFLREQLEWALCDLYQGENDKANNADKYNASNAHVSFLEIANHFSPNADQHDPRDLAVLISRDPQKIGEMSSGQRWHSCMASDGVNFNYVPKDIEAGTLIAYVIHKDDIEGRYPLMRRLIKPFRNEDGVTILVPGSLYGGDGAKKSRNALDSILNRFVARQNEDKIGPFRMDQSLYADGQAQYVILQADWSHERLADAIKLFREGALTEAMTELKINVERLARGETGNHGEDPRKNIKGLRNRIRNIHVVSDYDSDASLDRIFFRNIYEASIGTIPNPHDIAHVIKHSLQLQEIGKFYKFIAGGKTTDPDDFSSTLSSDQRIEIAATVGAISDFDGSGLLLKPHWMDEIETLECYERLEKYRDIAAFQERGSNANIHTLGRIIDTSMPMEHDWHRIHGFKRVLEVAAPGEQKDLVWAEFTNTVTNRKKKHEHIAAFLEITNLTGNEVSIKAAQILFDLLHATKDEDLPNWGEYDPKKQRPESYKAIIRATEPESLLHKQAIGLFFSSIEKYYEPYEHDHLFRSPTWSDGIGSDFLEECYKRRLIAAANDDRPHLAIYSAKQIRGDALGYSYPKAIPQNPQTIFLEAGEIILRNIPKLESDALRLRAAHEFYEENTDLCDLHSVLVLDDQRLLAQIKKAKAIIKNNGSIEEPKPSSRLVSILSHPWDALASVFHLGKARDNASLQETIRRKDGNDALLALTGGRDLFQPQATGRKRRVTGLGYGSDS